MLTRIAIIEIKEEQRYREDEHRASEARLTAFRLVLYLFLRLSGFTVQFLVCVPREENKHDESEHEVSRAIRSILCILFLISEQQFCAVLITHQEFLDIGHDAQDGSIIVIIPQKRNGVIENLAALQVGHDARDTITCDKLDVTIAFGQEQEHSCVLLCIANTPCIKQFESKLVCRIALFVILIYRNDSHFHIGILLKSQETLIEFVLGYSDKDGIRIVDIEFLALGFRRRNSFHRIDDSLRQHGHNRQSNQEKDFR